MKPILVEDLMSTSLITLHHTDTVGAAIRLMGDAAIHHLPVIDAHDHVIGLLSDRDLFRGLAGSFDPSSPIATLMTREVRRVQPSTLAADATRLMIEHGISSLPVENEQGVLIGILTSRDVLEAAERSLRGARIARA